MVKYSHALRQVCLHGGDELGERLSQANVMMLQGGENAGTGGSHNLKSDRPYPEENTMW